MFKIGVFGIIENDQGKILLCHRTDHDLWNLPGGGVEKGETPWEALIREVEEETGLEVEIGRLVGLYSKPNKDEIVLTFVCRVTGGKLTLNAEADQINYFEFQKIPTNTIPKHVGRIEDYFDKSTNTHLKVEERLSVQEFLIQINHENA